VGHIFHKLRVRRSPVGCCSPSCPQGSVSGVDASVKASMVDEGASEADLLRVAGRPTRRMTPPFPDCIKAGGTHELIYDVKIRYVGGWLGEDLSSLVAFCIGPSSRIIKKAQVTF
jgi:hypothetical protein